MNASVEPFEELLIRVYVCVWSFLSHFRGFPKLYTQLNCFHQSLLLGLAHTPFMIADNGIIRLNLTYAGALN